MDDSLRIGFHSIYVKVGLCKSKPAMSKTQLSAGLETEVAGQLFIKKEAQLTSRTAQKESSIPMGRWQNMEGRTPKVQEKKITVACEITVKTNKLSSRAPKQQEVQKCFLGL